MNTILVLQPYVGRTISELEETGEIAYKIYCDINRRSYHTPGDVVITVPDAVRNLYPKILDLDPEDEILGDQSFILAAYIQLLDEADTIIVLNGNNSWHMDEINTFSYMTDFRKYCDKRIYMPFCDLIINNWKEYTYSRDPEYYRDPKDLNISIVCDSRTES